MSDSSAGNGGGRESSLVSQKAGLVVSIASVLFVLALIGLLFFSAWLQHLQLAPIEPMDGNLEEHIHPTQLEMHYQNMKSVRFGYALLYRFSLWTAVVIIALAMIVLGSVLIFDRVRENKQAMLKLGQSSLSPGFEFMSQFPGLMMVVLGTITLGGTLYVAGPGAKPITVIDAPIFVPDYYERGVVDVPLMIVDDNEMPPKAALQQSDDETLSMGDDEATPEGNSVTPPPAENASPRLLEDIR